MRQKKSVWNRFRFYDGNGLARYLEAQAEKGWMLDNIVNNYITFRREEPRKVHYAVVFIPKPDDPTANVQARDQEFLEFCAHDGWERVCSYDYKRVFQNLQDDPTPIYSDPEMELENIENSARKYRKSQFGAILLASFYVFSCCLKLFVNFVSTISDPVILLLVSGTAAIHCSVIVQLLTYHFWHRRVRQAVDQGQSIDQVPCGHDYSNLLPWMLLLLPLLCDVKLLPVYIGAAVLIPLFILPASYLARDDGPKNGKPQNDYLRAAGFVGLIMLPAVLLFSFGVYVTTADVELELGNSVNNSLLGRALGWEDMEQPLYPEVYMFDAEPGTQGEWDSQASVFVEKYTLKQGVTVNGESVSVRYSVVKVRMESLYSLCRDDLLKYNDWNDLLNYTSVDAAVWGANEAYQLMDGDDPWNVYLLCYDGILVEFRPGCELTEEQMRICGEKFLSCVD